MKHEHIFPARHGLATHAEKADTLAALPGDTQGTAHKGRAMPKFIKVWDAIAVLDIPPSTFIAALKEDRKELPIFIDYIGIASKGCVHLTEAEMRQDLEDFYAGRAASEDILSFSLLLVQDVKAWKSKKATTSITELEADNEQLKTRITELETKLAACREQLEKARVENPSPNTKTSTATQVRQEKSLADWKDAFKVMVPVILQCQKEGPKPRTTPELEKMCARYNGTLDKSKMAFLRECLKECLGPEHVNTTGGPTIQG